MSDLGNLRQEIENNPDVFDSAVALIQGLKQKLDEALAGEDAEVELHLLSDAIGDSHLELARAVAGDAPEAETPAIEETPDAPPAA